MHVQRFFEQGHDHDHQDHLRQARFQIVQIVDHQDFAGSLAAMCLIDVADEQLVQTQREDQHHRGQQITVHHFNDVRYGAVVQGFTRLVSH